MGREKKEPSWTLSEPCEFLSPHHQIRPCDARGGEEGDAAVRDREQQPVGRRQLAPHGQADGARGRPHHSQGECGNMLQLQLAFKVWF